MTDNLKIKTAKSTVWNMLDRFGQQVIYLLVGIILARTLAVEDFALIGMLSLFVALSSILIDSGFSGAFVREKKINPDDFSALWGFNMLISVVLYSVLFFSAPLIADFFHQPKLVPLSRCLFLALPINAAGIIQSVVLTRQINFKTLAKINMLSLLLSGTAAVTMALTGFGVWALVAQPLLFAVSKSSLLWLHRSQPVSLRLNFAPLKKFLSFTVNSFFTSLLSTLFQNTYHILIGRFFSGNIMGYYTQASKYADIPDRVVNGPIQNITLAAFANLQDDAERLKRASQKSFRTACFLIFPVMVGLIIIARPLLLLLLGTKWEAIIPYFQLICAANIFAALTSQNYTFLHVKGKANIVLRLEAVKIGLFFVSLFFTLQHGITVMLYGLIIVRLLSFLITAFVAGRQLYYTLFMQLTSMLPYLLISLAMFAVCHACSFIVTNLYLLGTLQVVVGGSFYVLANELLGSKVYKDAKEMVVDQLKNGKLSIAKFFHCA